jgi:hypothetical protein
LKELPGRLLPPQAETLGTSPALPQQLVTYLNQSLLPPTATQQIARASVSGKTAPCLAPQQIYHTDLHFATRNRFSQAKSQEKSGGFLLLAVIASDIFRSVPI